MHHQGFDRLIKAMDELADQIDEPVVMQIGASTYEPVHAEWFRFDTQERADELCAAARVIVGHAGAGTLISAFHCRRPIVVIPRRFGHGEHVDDHQIELAKAVSAQNKAIMVDEPTLQGLLDGMNKATDLVPAKRDRGNLAEAILETLENSTPAGR
jgi:UDP-N-acetylglucosamine transferase subunit ALG13